MIESRTIGSVRLYICRLGDAASRRDAEVQAVEALLRRAFGERCVLSHDSEGAPFIAGSDVSISISHSRTHAALAVCGRCPVGVDIETRRPQLARVAPRVLSPAELEVYGAEPDGLLRTWTLKEALYKAALTPGVDFRSGIVLPLGDKKNEATVASPAGGAMCFEVLASEVSEDGALGLVVRRQSFVP